MAMERPSTLLTFLAAVLCASTPTTLSKLPGELLPLAAFVVGTLSNASTGIILAAEVPHNNTSPVLHVGTVVADCEFFHQRENIIVIWQEIFLFQFLFPIHRHRFRIGVLRVKQVEFLADLEAGDQVAVLEIRSQVAVLGNVCKKLQGHQDILFTGHGGYHLGVRQYLAVK